MRNLWLTVLIAFGTCGMLYSAASGAPIRQWRDVSGTFSVQAELVEVKGGKAYLKKADGNVIGVPTDKLSEADRKYLAELTATKPATKAPTEEPVVQRAPAPARAPFDATQAKAYQEAWAKHLGTQVEMTNSVGMKLVLIPAGEFLMGSTDAEVDQVAKFDASFKKKDAANEKPQYRVRITKAFYLGTTEVTQSQWQQVMGTEPWKKGNANGPDYPATFVSWDDALEFCKKLTEKERKAGRLTANASYTLPTEAQWEYACRAGTTTAFSFGNDATKLGDHGWYGVYTGAGNTKKELYADRVGQKQANAWGVYDLHGNVWEWCQDWYDEKQYRKPATDDPQGPAMGSTRVIRGGGWREPASNCRSACRLGVSPSFRNDNPGLRVLSVPSVEQ